MSSPLSEPIVAFGRTSCDKCGAYIYSHEYYYEVTKKSLRKKGLDIVCCSCAEGIKKDWEANK